MGNFVRACTDADVWSHRKLFVSKDLPKLHLRGWERINPLCELHTKFVFVLESNLIGE